MPPAPNNLQSRIALSRQEMCLISHTISRDFSPKLFGSRRLSRAQRRFTPQELLEISQQISREFAPSRVSHQSRLVLLAVSPRRLHAYWHVAKRLLNSALNRIEPESMMLRIYVQPDSQESDVSQDQNLQDWFDVPIHSEEGQQDVLLPETFTVNTSLHFSAALGQTNKEQIFTPVTYSNTTEASHQIPLAQRIELSKVIAPFIMPAAKILSTVVKTASSQGKDLNHE